MNLEDYKWCPKCEKALLKTAFAPNQSRKDKVQPYCKPCFYKVHQNEPENIARKDICPTCGLHKDRRFKKTPPKAINESLEAPPNITKDDLRYRKRSKD
jgi:hypothetical protein